MVFQNYRGMRRGSYQNFTRGRGRGFQHRRQYFDEDPEVNDTQAEKRPKDSKKTSPTNEVDELWDLAGTSISTIAGVNDEVVADIAVFIRSGIMLSSKYKKLPEELTNGKSHTIGRALATVVLREKQLLGKCIELKKRLANQLSSWTRDVIYQELLCLAYDAAKATLDLKKRFDALEPKEHPTLDGAMVKKWRELLPELEKLTGKRIFSKTN